MHSKRPALYKYTSPSSLASKQYHILDRDFSHNKELQEGSKGDGEMRSRVLSQGAALLMEVRRR